MYSVGRGMLRSPGATQCPTTPAPIMSRDQFVVSAVPDEQRGAGTAAAVDFV